MNSTALNQRSPIRSGRYRSLPVEDDNSHHKVLLIILDGLGEGKPYPGNAITQAKIPYIRSLRKNYPTTLLKCSGNAVGLPKGFQGNSEVGHFTIGAGRVVWQSLEAINQAIRNKQFFSNSAFLSSIQNVKKHHSALHLIGMISDEGVHSQIDHLFALIKLASDHHLKKVYIHAITDGRDVPEKSAQKYIRAIDKTIKKYKTGKIVSIIGRYYAMDRDNNWERTQFAYQLLTEGSGRREKDACKAIENGYALGDSTDYYLKPITLDPKITIKNHDSVIFVNYRTDRARQLTFAFTKEKKIPLKTKNLNIHFTTLGPYSKKAHIAFSAPKVTWNLGKIIDSKGLKQLRIAETEKYAHVTFFFNSQRKEPYPSETRILVNSPKVPSYDEKPEMSAPEITEKILPEIKKGRFDLMVLNFANADLVGHSGNLKATIRSVEVLEECLKKIIPAALEKNYAIILTADHGNAERKLYPNGIVCPAHSVNPVACTIMSKTLKHIALKKGKGLSSIAPTILDIMGIEKPKEMTGESLINL
ncbi:2,3-bisphosphoglycerate-independent phosphoglycerate mutase [Candidatus Peregrinibacteria bacterium]|nr:2,3-bisphosphoglycerate-independent phosphoglycerate mutase [Candidatus Peregrinibacteria bacterium]